MFRGLYLLLFFKQSISMDQVASSNIMVYNNTYHIATNMPAFETLYGYPTLSITSFLQDHSKVQAVDSHMEKTKETSQIIKENLQMAQNMMKQETYQHQSETKFEVGDWIFLRL